MRAGWIVLGGLLLVVTMAGGPSADDASPAADASAPGAPPSPVPSLLLSIRVRALGIETAPAPELSSSLGLETVKAPTGAGTSRMPSTTTELARGVYLTVMPVCLPGVDEVGFPPAARRRTQPVRRQ